MMRRLVLVGIVALATTGCIGEQYKNAHSTGPRVSQPRYVQIFDAPGGWHNIVEICDNDGNLIIEGNGVTVVPHGC